MPEFIVGLFCFLVMMTVLGHGIWVFFAWIIRLAMGRGRSQPLPRDCPACGQKRAVVAGMCSRCGATPFIAPGLAEQKAEPADDVEATVRKLGELSYRGAIPQELFNDLVRVVRGASESLDEAREQRTDGDTTSVPDAARPQPVARDTGETPFAADEPADYVEATVVGEEDGVTYVDDAPSPAASTTTASSHPLDRVDEPPSPALPRRPFATLLQAFMEEKNIRWGEIISGLLIVVCAVGLVVSLWATLRNAIPYLPALIFMLGTAAFHGASHYTLRKWDLQSVSRAALIIATLLIPLNFLAAITLSGSEEQRQSVTDPTYLLAVTVGVAAYGTMAFHASRTLLQAGSWYLFVAVMGTSIGQLISNRLYSPSMAIAGVLLIAALPVASYLAAVIGQLWRGRHWKKLSPRRAQPLFLVLGIATFALGCALALVVSKAESTREVLAQLSPAISLVGASVLATGLFIHSRTTSRKLATQRLSGTALAIGGAFVLLAAVCFAWPRPALLIVVGAVNGMLLVVMALLGRLPILHPAGIACGALAWIVGTHCLLDTYPPDVTSWSLASSFFTGQTAVTLTVYALAVNAVGAALWHTSERSLRGAETVDNEPPRVERGLRSVGRFRNDLIAVIASTTVVVALSVVLAVIVGFLPLDGQSLAPPLLLLHAASVCVTGWILNDRRVTWVASALVLIPLVQSLGYVEPFREWLTAQGALPRRPVLVAFLAHSVLCVVASALAGRRDAWLNKERLGEARWTGLVRPLLDAALVTAMATAPFSFAVRDFNFLEHSSYVGVIAGVWLGAALIRAWPQGWAVANSAAFVAIAYAVAGIADVRSWDDFWAVPHLATQVVVLGGVCAAWCLARWINSTVSSTRGVFSLFRADWATADQYVLGGLVAGLVFLATRAAAPGVLGEIGVVDPETRAGWSELGFGGYLWSATLVVILALAASLWERITQRGLAGLVVSGAALPLLLAGPFEDSLAGASAARWTFAVYGFVLVGMFASRERLLALMRRRDWPGLDVTVSRGVVSHELLAIMASGFIVFLLTTLTVMQVASGATFGGPLPDSIFARMGSTANYATPLAIVTATLLGFAVRERQAGFALAGSFMFQYTATLGCLLPVLSAGAPLDQATTAQLLQWNAAALGIYGLIWLALRDWIEHPDASEASSDWIDVFDVRSGGGVRLQVVLAIGAVVILAICSALGIVLWPHDISEFVQQLGGAESYVALGLAVAATVWLVLPRLRSSLADLVTGGLTCLATFVAASCGSASTASDWLSLHVLMVGWAIVTAAATLVACRPEWLVGSGNDELTTPARCRFITWVANLGTAVAILSIIAAIWDPVGEWWALGATLSIALAIGVAAFVSRSQKLASASVVLVGLAVTYLWAGVSPARTWADPVLLFDWVVAATAFAACIWLAIEVESQRRLDHAFQPDFKGPRVHRWVGVVLLVVLTIVLSLATLVAAVGRTESVTNVIDISTRWGGLAVFAVGLLLIGTMWDRIARGSVAFVYAWGFPLMAIVIDAFELKIVHWFFACGLAASAYVALTGLMWRRGANLAAIGASLGISDPVAGLRVTNGWLPIANGLLSLLGAFVGLIVVLFYEERALRVGAGFFPVMLAIGVGALAQAGRRAAMQLLSLWLVVLSAVYLSWGDIEPQLAGDVWLERMNRLLIVLCAAAFGYSYVVARQLDPEGDWYQSVKRAVVSIGALAFAVLTVILLLEAGLFFQNPTLGAPVTDLSLIAVAVVMVGLVVALVTMAVLPGRDPLALSEQGRQGYVYAAQIAAALLFAHLFLARPFWFSEELRAYWPYIIVTVAFAGAGAGELLQRAGWTVVGEPLQRSGAFLPLVPAIGMWIAASESDYSVLLFLTGVVYLLVSIGRKSTLAAFAAAAAGNGALWSMLHDTGFALWEHPQFWMLPPAVSLLVAAEVNRKRLPPEALTAIRYASMLVIYLSSGGEMFIRGIGEQLWPPMVLLGLSVAGAMAGVMFRVRAFLYLGSTFILLSLISMVWHASVAIEQSWPWWAFGIGLGIAMLILFGIFEKQRDKVAAVLEELKQWEQ